MHVQQRRFATAIAAEFSWDGAHARGEIGNVGLGGLFVESRQVPEQGEMVRLRFAGPDGQPILLDGIVWWTTPEGRSFGRSPGFGVRLLEGSAAYEALIDRLSETQPPRKGDRRGARRAGRR